MKIVSQFKQNLRSLRSVALILLAVGVVGSTIYVSADTYDEQISALRAQNNAASDAISGLSSLASSYQDQINQLQSQISALQGEISKNQAQQADLAAQIDANQKEIETKKSQLAEQVKAMYYDGQMSALETLASSGNLSEYVDKQEYRSLVQENLNTKLNEINKLQDQLKRKKTELETLAASLKSQNDQLASSQSQLSNMLAYNQQQQAEYTAQISSNSSKIADLRKQQAIENARYNIGSFRGDPGNGGYPNVWANAPQDSLIDSWGMYNRECVSYTAWKVHQDFIAGKNDYDMPYWGGIGNANQWDDNARRMGIPVDSTPTVGSIAVSNAGYYGHVMYVEAVNGNSIYISQYNASLNGQYSEGWRSTTGLVFIHF